MTIKGRYQTNITGCTVSVYPSIFRCVPSAVDNGLKSVDFSILSPNLTLPVSTKHCTLFPLTFITIILITVFTRDSRTIMATFKAGELASPSFGCSTHSAQVPDFVTKVTNLVEGWTKIDIGVLRTFTFHATLTRVLESGSLIASGRVGRSIF